MLKMGIIYAIINLSSVGLDPSLTSWNLDLRLLCLKVPGLGLAMSSASKSISRLNMSLSSSSTPLGPSPSLIKGYYEELPAELVQD